MQEQLLEKIEARTAVVGIIGLGYAGLPLAVAFAEAGFPVLGRDLDAGRVAAVNAGRTYLTDLPDERLAALAGRLTASTDPAVLAECDAITICVPTPLSKARDPDISYVVAATEQVVQNRPRRQGAAARCRVRNAAADDQRDLHARATSCRSAAAAASSSKICSSETDSSQSG